MGGNIALRDFFLFGGNSFCLGGILKVHLAPSTMHNTKTGGSKVHFYDLIPYDNDTNLSICNAWFVFQKYLKPQKEMK